MFGRVTVPPGGSGLQFQQVELFDRVMVHNVVLGMAQRGRKGIGSTFYESVCTTRRSQMDGPSAVCFSQGLFSVGLLKTVHPHFLNTFLS